MHSDSSYVKTKPSQGYPLGHHCLLITLSALALHRAALLYLPHFRPDLERAALANIAIGLTSDLSLAALLIAVAAAFDRHRSRWLQATFVMSTLVWVAMLAAHIRYVEHFGFTLRLFHVTKIVSLGTLTASIANVTSAPMAVTLLVLPPVVASVLLALGTRLKKSLGAAIAKRAWLAGGALAVSVSAHGFANHFKAKPAINRELRFNPLAAIYYNWAEERRHGADVPRTPEALSATRALLHGARAFADETGSYPLWQAGLRDEIPDAGAGKHYHALRAFLAAEAARLGPWNVVLVLSESMRAAEIESDAALFSRLPAWFDRGVSFSDVYSAGMHTSNGQLASQCSAYNPGDLDLMFTTPRNRLVCLGDVFAAKGYETYFFYGSDNAFDNQKVFYETHSFRHVFGEERFPPSTSKAGWGYSDHAVYEDAMTTLRAEKHPFFATILSLSNHLPHKVPADAPDGLIDSRRGLEDQILQYVDWSLSELLRRIDAELPHTLVFVVADHGIFRGESVGNHDWSVDTFRTVTKIPWLIYASGLPESLRGARVDSVASLADIPPTLLSLLDWRDVPHQFMGWNAFDESRRRVLINWQNGLYSIGAKANAPVAVPREAEGLLSSLVLGDLLAPR